MYGKARRILSIYQRVLEGKAINKYEESIRFEVNERTIQRDLDDIRRYLKSGTKKKRSLIYDHSRNGYVLEYFKG